jgi:hypothetical protein
VSRSSSQAKANVKNSFFLEDEKGRKHPQRKQIIDAIRSWKKLEMIDRPDFR